MGAGDLPLDPFDWVGATVAGKYRVDAVVAEGGFGIVYRAHHLGFDTPVAFKCLKLPARLQGAGREDFLRAFVEEGRLLHQLSRSTVGIVQAMDVGAETSPNGTWTPYLALEWLDGSTLEDDLVARAAAGLPGRTLTEAIALLETAARALAVAHEQGIAHRDIKPGNLFVTDLGGRRIVKVVDFGIAKVMTEVTSLTRALQATGTSLQAFTPQYGAPEQFDRSQYGATGPWTDVFAFALVLVEVLSGRVALDGANTTQLFISSVHPARRPTPRQCGVHVPDAVEAVMARAVAIQSRDRFRTAGEFWDALVAAALRVSSSEAFAPTALPPSKRTELAPPISLPASSWPGSSSTTSPHVASAPALIPPGPPSTRRRSRVPTVVLAVGGAVLVGAGIVTFVALRPKGVAQGTPAAVDSAPDALPVAVTGSAPRARVVPAVKMVHVPAGSFIMGSDEGALDGSDADAGPNPRAPRRVTLSHGFSVDKTEVTVSAYQACVAAEVCTPSGIHGGAVPQVAIDHYGPMCNVGDPARTEHPINCIDRMQAAAYCQFVGKRLPTEAEWEYAARGGDARPYPWGSTDPTCELGAFRQATAQGRICRTDQTRTMSVGSFPSAASPFGALDMAGNVWEWVDDGWDKEARAHTPPVDPHVALSGPMGVLRGGSWDFVGKMAQSFRRLPFKAGDGQVSTGVRCVKSD